ncbi:condensation domain-containing protein [Nostoc sp.]|uniref:condensation domain-containing protein n=1 Tax=Nostoc sp. TaxID=1180 RepID=UPI002FFA4739
MSDLSQQIANLSPKKRELFLQRLNKKKGDVFSQKQIKFQSRKSNCFPMSFAQQRLWFVDQLQPGNSAYHIPIALRITGLLNIAALLQTLNEIVRRHEVLRTSFATVEGQLVQLITPTLSLTLPIINLQELPEVEREAEVRKLVMQEIQQPFNLNQVPLLRTTLLQLSKVEHIVIFTMHHIVSDAWSLGVLIQEFVDLYKAFFRGELSPLPDLQIQYADFAVWQRQWLQGEKLKTQLSYWKRQLEGAPTVLQLPLDRPRPQVQSSRGALQTLTISQNLTKALNFLSRQEGVTLYITLLAAFNLLLYYYTGQDDILVGSPIANRNRAETERLIGFFVNTLVMRTNLSGNPSFRELLGRVREIALEAYAHQDLPFEKLVESLQLERNLSYNPLFQVWFVLQNVTVQTLELPNLKIFPLQIDNRTARHDLKVDLTETHEEIRGSFEYRTDLFNATIIARMTQLFELLLRTVTEQPDTKMNNIKQILMEVDKQQQNITETELKTSLHQKLQSGRRRTSSNISRVQANHQDN